MALELWTSLVAIPGRVASAAARAEAAGWTGVTITDSQNLAGDVYVGMAAALGATTRLWAASGVTNPFTRHPAVTAAALWHLQIESRGRAALGLGRGDSALAHIGLAPAPVEVLETYLDELQTYLRGGSVPLEDAAAGGHRPIAGNLPVADRPDDSRLHWLALAGELEKPHVFVVASGPRVLGVAAAGADRVALAVGADPARVQWAIDTARAINADVPIGAYVNVVVDDDLDRARAIGAGGINSFSRFSAMHGHAAGPLPDEQRAVIESIPAGYNLKRHFQTSPQAQALPPEYIDQFGIVGPAGHCVDRLLELNALGIDQFFVVGPTGDVDRDASSAARRRFIEDVLPKVQSA